MDSTAISTTCGACHGSGRHAHGYRGGVCDYCGGSGLYIDECRGELIDSLSDALWDAETPDAHYWTSFANAVGNLLADRGYLADCATIAAIATRLNDTCDLDVSWDQYARAVVALLEERGMDVTQVARP